MNTKKHVLLSVIIVAALAALFVRRRFAAPLEVSTQQLWGDRDAWTGKTVEVAGDMKEFGAGTADDHFVLENEGYRVGVRGDAHPAAQTLVGTRVKARGVFVFTEKTGGYLESPELSLSDARR